MTLQERIENFLRENRRQILKEAEALREAALPALTEEMFALFETTGNRLVYETAYFERRKRLAVLALAVILERDPRDIARLEAVIGEICQERCWELPAHVDRTRPNWEVTAGLFACETAFALAEIRHVCRDMLSAGILEMMRMEVERRVLLPVQQRQVCCKDWEKREHNWNAVCAGSIGGAALYLWQDTPKRLAELLYRLCDSLTCYVGGFGDDGTCVEGLSYYTYGLSYYCMFADLLETFGWPGEGEAPRLLDGGKMKKIMEFQQKCYFPGGLSVCFSDGSSHERFRVGLTCFMAMRDKQVVFPAWNLAADLHADSCYRWATLYRDILFTERFVRSGEKRAERPDTGRFQETLPDAQWIICRQMCAGEDGAGLAAIGGHNGVPHNHNDVGSFHYAVGGELFLADLGAGEYTKEYFRDETRYTIFVNQTQSHNLPLIDGEGQKYGRRFACERFSTDGNGRIEMELAAAYGDERLRRFCRSLQFEPQDGRLLVCDTFEADRELQITENFVTPYEPKRTADGFLLQGAAHACALRMEEAQKAWVDRVEYPDHEGRTRTVYRIQWEAPVKQPRTTHVWVQPCPLPAE